MQRWSVIVLSVVLGCSKPPTYPSNFATVKIEAAQFLDASAGKPYSGTLVARDQEIAAVAKSILGDATFQRVERTDPTGLVIVVPMKNGVPDGNAKLLIDLRAPTLNPEVARRHADLVAIARELSPHITLATATFKAGKLDGIATVFAPAGSSGTLAKVAEVQFRDHVLHGTSRAFHPGTSQVHRELTFEAGAQAGPQRTFHENGKLAREASYVANEPHGEVKEYFADSKLRARRSYDHGAPTGTHETWYPDGQRASELIHEAGTVAREQRWLSNGQSASEPPNGTVKDYYSSGRVRESTTYVGGVKQGPYQSFYANGRTWKEGAYENDQLHGRFISVYKNGKPALQASYVRGALDGEYKRWYANGTKWETATYVAGKRVGPYRKWWKNGKPAHVYTYDSDGKLDGDYRQFYDNGAKWAIATYAKGKPQGPIQRWYHDGRLGYEMNHKNGRPDGPYRRWYVDGKPRLEATYVNGVLDGDFKNWREDGNVYEMAVYQRGQKIQSSRETAAPPK